MPILPVAKAEPSIADLDSSDRRIGRERRERTFHGLWKGHALRRRRSGRRLNDAHPAGIDWHDAHWLGAAVLVVVLCVVDALMTLTLMKHGAQEVNPLMAPLVVGSGHGFAYWKLGLTISGVVVLVVLARARLFGVVPAGVLLYVVLCIYIVLVAYEWQLLTEGASRFVSYWFGNQLHYPA
jgi:Domain of unknown function (DUF5658)